MRVQLMVAITGVNEDAVLRRGDISATGLYLEINHDVGPMGSLQRMVLTHVDDPTATVTVLARIVRIAAIDDFWKGRVVVGVAFHFLFQAPSSGVRELVGQLAKGTLASGQSLELEHGLEIEGQGGVRRAGALTGLSPSELVLETTFPVPVGEAIWLRGQDGAGESKRLCGRAVETRPCAGETKRYRTVVSFPETPRTGVSAKESIAEAIDGVLTKVLEAEPSEFPPTRHLGGALARVSVTSVLTLCAQERTTGIVSLQRGPDRAQIFLRAGEVVDVDGPSPGAPRESLRALLGWTTGEFELEVAEVDRPDRVGVPITALLLDLLREIDERAR